MLLHFHNPAEIGIGNFVRSGPPIKTYKELYEEVRYLLGYFPVSRVAWTICFSPILPFHNITEVERSRILEWHRDKLSSVEWNVFEFYSLQKVCCELNARYGFDDFFSVAINDCFIPLIDSGFFRKIHFSQPVEEVPFLTELRKHVQVKKIEHENIYV